MCTKSCFQIEQFFFCYPLRIGSLIIGYLGLIGNCFHLSTTVIRYEYFQTAVKSSFLMSHAANSTTTFDIGAYRGLQLLSVWIAYLVISIICHCALLWGTHTAKSEFVLPWLITKAIETTVAIVAGPILLFIIGVSRVHAFTICIIVVALIVSYWLMIYAYMCVYSHYYEIRPPKVPEVNGKIDPPAYISSVFEDDKQNLTEITINQAAV